MVTIRLLAGMVPLVPVFLGVQVPGNALEPQNHPEIGDVIWLVFWNMNFIFPNSWDDDPI